LAAALVWASVKSYTKPLTFLGIGGKKVFRDEISSKLRFPFQADHRYYRKHGMYDFSYKDYRARLTSRMLMLLTKIPVMRKEIYQKRIKEEMIKPLKKVIQQDG
jgi:hypothetical protein